LVHNQVISSITLGGWIDGGIHHNVDVGYAYAWNGVVNNLFGVILTKPSNNFPYKS
jgi:hypothetical protein